MTEVRKSLMKDFTDFKVKISKAVEGFGIKELQNFGMPITLEGITYELMYTADSTENYFAFFINNDLFTIVRGETEGDNIILDLEELQFALDNLMVKKMISE